MVGGRPCERLEKCLLVGASLGDKVQRAQQATRNVPEIYQAQDIQGLYMSNTVLIRLHQHLLNIERSRNH